MKSYQPITILIGCSLALAPGRKSTTGQHKISGGSSILCRSCDFELQCHVRHGYLLACFHILVLLESTQIQLQDHALILLTRYDNCCPDEWVQSHDRPRCLLCYVWVSMKHFNAVVSKYNLRPHTEASIAWFQRKYHDSISRGGILGHRREATKRATIAKK